MFQVWKCCKCGTLRLYGTGVPELTDRKALLVCGHSCEGAHYIMDVRTLLSIEKLKDETFVELRRITKQPAMRIIHVPHVYIYSQPGREVSEAA